MNSERRFRVALAYYNFCRIHPTLRVTPAMEAGITITYSCCENCLDGTEKAMNKVKSPQEKKLLSLEKDRRNTFGENSKSSRKNIAKGKQRQHMDERRGAAQALRQLKGEVDDDSASNAEAMAKVRIADSRNRGFKKKPDSPLGIVLANKSSKPF